ncbi:YjgF-like protein [Polyplosphaeria fusca]|uniref:YjgF-like protein n=1 Tax=Polyplosphaeria fusca TaxID=682080 RepID=A0A9P4QLS1_9PLEO|nr:YjgF-like protein [Polyplosphaeria fusca]
MSHLQYFDYPGFGERVRKETYYSQAVRIDNRIEISGQGGWDPLTESIPSDPKSQIAQACANVELALQKAGGKGWEQVYKVRAYVTSLDPELLAALAEQLRRYCPRHQPLLTGVQVAGLYRGMAVELEVEAYLG